MRFAVLLLATAVLPGHALAQCADQPCKNLGIVFQSAMIDFREYRSAASAVPNLSTGLASVACQMNTWANNVPMYVCYAEVPLAAGDSWFRSTVENARRLQSNWTFKVTGEGDNRYAEGGPQDCEVASIEGPFIGQCPFHAQMVRQANGALNLYLWINSFSSPYLLRHAPSPKIVRAAPQTCDDFCENFKKAFAARTNSFADLGATESGQELSPEASVRFPGARKCAITRATRMQADDPKRDDQGTRFACFWQEASAAAANARFRDLLSRVQPLVPAEWSARQQNEADATTGESVTTWLAVEPGAKHDVRLYLSGSSVALHLTSWSAPAP
jgi:hypothetical protein